MMRDLAPLSRLALACTALALLTLLGGCASPLNRPAPERHFYSIAAPRPHSEPPAADKTILKVRPLRISPAFQDKEMVYRMDAARYMSDFYNAFFVQPATAVTQATREWLNASGLFGNAVDSSSQVTDTHLLEGLINALYADFRDPANPKAVLEIQFFLLKNKKDDYAVVFSKNYRRETPFLPTGSGNAEALAQAYGNALADILDHLEADLRAVKK